jgi:ankyrin repeat protein
MTVPRSYNNLFDAIKAKDERPLAELIKGGADPDAPNEKGDTPLTSAAALNDLPCVRELCKNGADLDKTGKDGLTPLERADADGHAAVAGLLRASLKRRDKGRAIFTETAQSPELKQNIIVRRPLAFRPGKGVAP